MSEKSKEYLKKRGLKNPPIDSGISGGGDAPRVYVSDIMDEWNPYLTKQTTHLSAEVERLKKTLGEIKDGLLVKHKKNNHWYNLAYNALNEKA